MLNVRFCLWNNNTVLLQVAEELFVTWVVLRLLSTVRINPMSVRESELKSVGGENAQCAVCVNYYYRTDSRFTAAQGQIFVLTRCFLLFLTRTETLRKYTEMSRLYFLYVEQHSRGRISPHKHKPLSSVLVMKYSSNLTTTYVFVLSRFVLSVDKHNVHFY